MEQAIILLQLAMSLLSMLTSGVTPQLEPVRDQAISIAEQAINIANEEIARLQAPQPQATSQNTINEPNTPPATLNNTGATLEQVEPVLSAPITNQMQPTIKIISPIPGKGLGRKYKASDKVIDESNYIELGLLCRDNQGKSIKDAQVTVTATDATQNKTINGTGNITKIYNDKGEKETIHYYPFYYEFKTAGMHTITFSCNDLSEALEINVE